MVAFNAYRCNDTESDDLDGVDMDRFEEHLRAGEVQYFFRHKVEFVSKYGSKEELDHYFAFVEWFKTLAKVKKRMTGSLMTLCDLLEKKKKRRDFTRSCPFRNFTHPFIYKRHLLQTLSLQQIYLDASYNKKKAALLCKKNITSFRYPSSKMACFEIFWTGHLYAQHIVYDQRR